MANSRTLAAVLIFVVSCMAWMHLTSQSASAAVTLNGPGIIPFAPADMEPSITNCDAPSNVALGSYNWFGMWGSSRGVSTDNSAVSVAFGASVVPLQLNIMSVNCHDQSVTGNIHITNFHTFITVVTPSTPGATDNLSAGVTSIFSPYGAGQSAGHFGQGSIPFDYRPNGGFRNPGINTYTILVSYRGAYSRSDGTFGCAQNGAPIANLLDVSSCAEAAALITITVDVDSPSVPSVNFTATCDDTNGLVTINNPTVSDPDGGVLTVSGWHNNQTFSGSRTGSGSLSITPNPFTGIRNGITQSLTLTVADTDGATGTGSAIYLCLIPQPTVTCEFIGSGSTFEVGSAYYPSVRVINGNVSGAPPINASVTITVGLTTAVVRSTAVHGPINPNDDASFGTGSVDYTSSPADPVILSQSGEISTTATANWSSTAGGYSGTATCETPSRATTRVDTSVFRPYFKVLGGDLISYGASIRGFNQSGRSFDPATSCSTAIQCGAGVETSIQMNGDIEGVPSQSKRATTGNAKTLTYANTRNDAPYATWGGGFGGAIPGNDSIIPINAPIFPGFAATPAGATGEYRIVTTDFAGGAVPDGARVTVYVNGNVRITSNIVYAGQASYGSRTAIPHFRLIALGDIYVDPSVEQLDGEYIAGRTLYTCHNGSWGPAIVGVNIYAPCSARSLIVNGALVGDTIRLTRVVGTLRGAQTTDAYTSGCPSALIRGYCNTGNIGEIVQFTPELFLANPATSPTNSPLSGKYDSITALPPLF